MARWNPESAVGIRFGGAQSGAAANSRIVSNSLSSSASSGPSAAMRCSALPPPPPRIAATCPDSVGMRAISATRSRIARWRCSSALFAVSSFLRLSCAQKGQSAKLTQESAKFSWQSATFAW